jgi:ketosteroid isomerase-like protein
MSTQAQERASLTEHPTAARVREIEATLRAFSDDLLYHIPIGVPWEVGDRRGPIAIVEMWAQLMEWSENTFTSELLDVMGVGNFAVSINQVSATRKGRSHHWNTSWTYRFEGDVIVEAWLHASLPDDEIHDFWS